MLYKRLYDNYMVTKYIGANHSINSKFSWKPILKQHTFSFFFLHIQYIYMYFKSFSRMTRIPYKIWKIKSVKTNTSNRR